MLHKEKSVEETVLLLWRESENKLKLLGKERYFYLWPIWKEPGSNSHTPAGEGLQQCFGTEFAPRDKLRPLTLVWRLVTWMKQILGLIPSPHKHSQKHCSNCVGHIILHKCSRISFQWSFEMRGAQCNCYVIPKRMMSSTWSRWLSVSEFNHKLKLFIKNKAFTPSRNLLFFFYFFRKGLFYNFLYLYLTSARGLQINSFILP